MAETVLYRGNGGEPETLDQARTSIDLESNILKDPYEGLAVGGRAKGNFPLWG
jgi:oligopeptide transport system substrate-binding protein